jgi:hypothetical protein
MRILYNDTYQELELEKTSLKEQLTILLIGNDTMLSYLLGRFCERSGHQLAINPENLSINEIMTINPAVIVFLSTEILETAQALVGELASFDFPIMVCSAVVDETKARKLGADYCLLHPITYDDFQKAMTNANISKRP